MMSNANTVKVGQVLTYVSGPKGFESREKMTVVEVLADAVKVRSSVNNGIVILPTACLVK